jgi:hypothetical protein
MNFYMLMFRPLTLLLATVTGLHAAPWYEEMIMGPARADSFEDTFQGEKRVAALKGILVDLGDDYKALFDTETLRVVTAYQGGFNWGGTPWTGDHGPLLGLKNESAIFNSAALPGWADSSGSFEDKRPIPGFGNLEHASFTGYYRHGESVVFTYEVLGSEIQETLSHEGATITRSFRLSGPDQDLVFCVADETSPFVVGSDRTTAKSGDGLGVIATQGIQLAADTTARGRLLAKIPKGATRQFQISLARGGEPKPAPTPDFTKLTSGGAPIFPEIIETKGTVSIDTTSAYVTDIATLPDKNPWKCNLRFGGFDFIDDDSAALSTWNGDVWVVRGLNSDWSSLKWQRIASGLFQPLGVRVVNGIIHVNGRDQITQLIDLNKDGETDFYKVFNRDVLVSANFHEFSFDLQTDKAGSFYFAKAAPVRGGGRGFDRILPHHGVVAKISPDGKKFDVIATGLRAPGGLAVGPNGEITTGENEGTWQPCCKLNFIAAGKTPVFFGTEPSRGSLKNAPYTEPLCYLPMSVDNSGGSQVWVPEGEKFGLPAATLLHLSYGQSTVYRVLPVARRTGIQGGVAKLPITLQSAAMRARFHPDGSLFVLGFRGWQTNAATQCAFQRIRHNQKSTVPVPEKMEYTATGVRLKFGVQLDQELAEDLASYNSERWNYVRGPQYGSGEFSVDHPDVDAEKAALEKESKGHNKHDTVEIKSAKLLPDGQTIELELVGMKPSMTLKLAYDLEDKQAHVLKGEIYATVYPN